MGRLLLLGLTAKRQRWLLTGYRKTLTLGRIGSGRTPLPFQITEISVDAAAHRARVRIAPVVVLIAAGGEARVPACDKGRGPVASIGNPIGSRLPRTSTSDHGIPGRHYDPTLSPEPTHRGAESCRGVSQGWQRALN